jgi:acyl-coenzyme A synthetase/AMP-(fatty) acid ligase
VTELPREDNGKIYKRRLRDTYRTLRTATGERRTYASGDGK